MKNTTLNALGCLWALGRLFILLAGLAIAVGGGFLLAIGSINPQASSEGFIVAVITFGLMLSLLALIGLPIKKSKPSDLPPTQDDTPK